VLVFIALWLTTVLPFDYRGAATRDIDFLWQSLGITFLTEDPLGSLSVLHTQPPGLNVLYAVDLALTPDSHLVLLAVNALAVIATIVMLTDATVRVARSIPTALVVGVIYALLPGTVLYSLYAYNTALTAFFAMLAVWPVSWAISKPALAVTLSSLGALGLVLTRSSFIWPAMLLWCGALVWWVSARSRWRWTTALGALIPVGLVLVVQVHYVVNFGLPFMSSWSGQNLAKALQTSDQLSVSPTTRTALEANTCHASIFTAWQAGDLNIWDPGGTLRQAGCRDLPPVIAREIPAWDEPLKPGSTEMNFNEGRALVASDQWTGLMTTIVRDDPVQLVRMAVTSKDGFTRSAVGLYLRPSDDYPFLDLARAHLPTATIAAPLAALFAPALWILVLIGWFTAAVMRRSPLRHTAIFWFASGLLVFHAAVSNLLEYSENMRYRAETDPILLLAGSLALISLLPRKNRR
jgi:hypothetical protein